jgi:hypothetical protein
MIPVKLIIIATVRVESRAFLKSRGLVQSDFDRARKKRLLEILGLGTGKAEVGPNRTDSSCARKRARCTRQVYWCKHSKAGPPPFQNGAGYLRSF